MLSWGISHFDPLLPLVGQGLCVAQLGLGTVFRRARLVLELKPNMAGSVAGEVCGDAILSRFAVAWPLGSRAQKPSGKMPTIGFLARAHLRQNQRTAAFVQRLCELSWIEGCL